MKIKKSILTLALVLVLVFSFAAGAAAAGTLETISAYLNYGITIRYNGEEQILKDAGGNRVYPITYNGTTYLPVRAVSNMLGINVDWDGATQTVILGEKPDGTDLIDIYKPYTSYVVSKGTSGCNTVFVQSSEGRTEAIGGETVSHWLHLRNNGEGKDGMEGMRTAVPLASFNIGGKYQSLTFKVYSNLDTTLTVKGDNDSILGEYEIVGGKVPQTISVNLLGTTQLTFERAAAGWESALTPRWVNAYIFDATLK